MSDIAVRKNHIFNNLWHAIIILWMTVSPLRVPWTLYVCWHWHPWQNSSMELVNEAVILYCKLSCHVTWCLQVMTQTNKDESWSILCAVLWGCSQVWHPFCLAIRECYCLISNYLQQRKSVRKKAEYTVRIVVNNLIFLAWLQWQPTIWVQ